MACGDIKYTLDAKQNFLHQNIFEKVSHMTRSKKTVSVTRADVD